MGSFALSLRWADLASVVFVVSVKSGPSSVRSVVWREKSHCKRRAFFASQKALTKKHIEEYNVRRDHLHTCWTVFVLALERKPPVITGGTPVTTSGGNFG